MNVKTTPHSFSLNTTLPYIISLFIGQPYPSTGYISPSDTSFHRTPSFTGQLLSLETYNYILQTITLVCTFRTSLFNGQTLWIILQHWQCWYLCTSIQLVHMDQASMTQRRTVKYFLTVLCSLLIISYTWELARWCICHLMAQCNIACGIPGLGNEILQGFGSQINHNHRWIIEESQKNHKNVVKLPSHKIADKIVKNHYRKL